MSIIKSLELEICNSINSLGYNLEKVTLNTSSRKEFGEYQINDAMSLGKTFIKILRKRNYRTFPCYLFVRGKIREK